ncbi:MAG: hypothetical protein ABWZ90_03320, partial [Acidimicrobiales bacterium]
ARFVDRVFAAFNGTILQRQSEGPLGTVYVAHGDPSLSQANFGLAIGHLEVDERDVPHVVFDLLHHWAPSDFPEGVVDYVLIEEEIFDLVKRFGIQTLTFDPWNSAASIQRLQRRIDQAHLPRRTQVIERNPTAELNWEVAEIFKTAIGHDLIHAHHYPLADAELRGLELQNGKVRAPTTGPVVTKDVADAMMWTTYTLIGKRATEIFDRLASLPILAGVPVPSLHQPVEGRPDPIAQLRALTWRNRPGPAAAPGQYYNPARGISRRPGRRGLWS